MAVEIGKISAKHRVFSTVLTFTFDLGIQIWWGQISLVYIVYVNSKPALLKGRNWFKITKYTVF